MNDMQMYDQEMNACFFKVDDAYRFYRLGLPFLQKFITIFDPENERVGFVERKEPEKVKDLSGREFLKAVSE